MIAPVFLARKQIGRIRERLREPHRSTQFAQRHTSPSDGSSTPTSAPGAIGRVVVVSTLASTIEAFLLPHVAELRRRGFAITAAANFGGALGPSEHFDAIVDLPFSRPPTGLRRSVMSAWKLRKQLQHHDIALLNTPLAAAVSRLAALTLAPSMRATVIYVAHGFHYYRGRRDVVGVASLLVERLLVSSTDILVVMNQEDLHTAVHLLGYQRKQVHLLPGVGVDLQRFRPEGTTGLEFSGWESRLGSGTRVVVAVGDHTAEKRMVDAVGVLALLPEDVHLVLLGRGGNESGALLREAERHALLDRTHFAGRVRDVRPFLARAQCLYAPSAREGLPRIVMEAMAMEVPVIASRVRGHVDLLGQVPGALVPLGDTAAASSRIAAVLASSSESRLMARSAAHVITAFDVDRSVSRLIALCNDALGAPSPQERAAR